jgi:hypothetical protein
MKKPRGAKQEPSRPLRRGAGHEAKSQRRILRVVSHWTHVSAIVAAGGKPDLDDIAYLLRLGELVPSDVQNYLADLLDAPPKGKGRPTKHPGQIKSDQWRSARALFDAIDKIRTAGRPDNTPLSVAKACEAYADGKGPDAKSVEREYRAAEKLLLADVEHLNTPTHQWFLSHAVFVSSLRKGLKKRKNK